MLGRAQRISATITNSDSAYVRDSGVANYSAARASVAVAVDDGGRRSTACDGQIAGDGELIENRQDVSGAGR